LVAKDKTQNPINFLYIQMAASMLEKNAALKKRERCANWIPTDNSFVGGFGGRIDCASSEQGFFGCDNKIKVH
jgi:hypothetical protein